MFRVNYLGLAHPYGLASELSEKTVEANSVSEAILAYNEGDADSVREPERYLVSLEPVVVEIERESFSYSTVAPS